MEIVQINGVWYVYSFATGYVRIQPPQRRKATGWLRSSYLL